MKKTNTKLAILLLPVIIALLLAPAGAVLADGGVPPLPNAFYGDITTNAGQPAVAGVTVEAKVDEEVVGTITTTEAGKYGGADPGDASEGPAADDVHHRDPGHAGEHRQTRQQPFHLRHVIRLHNRGF